MNATKKLLDKFAQTCASGLDKEMAAKLHVKHSTVSNWKAGRAHPDAEYVEKMALAIGEPVAPWLMLIEAERARTAGAKRVWLRHATTVGIAIALLIAALPSRVHAETTATSSSQFDISKVDILVHLQMAIRFDQTRFRPPRPVPWPPRYRSSVLELTLPFQGITRSWNHTMRPSESMGAIFVSTEEAKCPGRKSS